MGLAGGRQGTAKPFCPGELMTHRQEIQRLAPLYLLAVAAPVSVSVGNVAVGLVLVTALAAVLRHRRSVTWPARPVLLALGALLGFYFLSTLLAAPYPQPWHKFAEEMWIKLLLVAVPVLAAGRVRRLESAMKLALMIGALAAVFAIVQHFLGADPIRGRSIYRPQFGHNAVSGFFSHHLSYAGQALIFLLMAAAWFLDRPGNLRRLWLLPVPAVLAVALMWTFARSAMIGALAGLLVLIVLQEGRARWLGLGGVLAGTAAVLGVGPVRGHFLQLFDLDRHLTRVNLWHSSWDGLNGHPLLGFGTGNFESMLAGFQVPGHYENLGHAHNDLLMHGVNAGWPGLLAALALLGATCALFWQARGRAAGERWILTGALAVQVGITVAGFFQVYQTDDEVEMLLYFVLGCAVALAGSGGDIRGRAKPGV
jgi:O-antigen ligase